MATVTVTKGRGRVPLANEEELLCIDVIVSYKTLNDPGVLKDTYTYFMSYT